MCDHTEENTHTTTNINANTKLRHYYVYFTHIYSSYVPVPALLVSYLSTHVLGNRNPVLGIIDWNNVQQERVLINIYKSRKITDKKKEKKS